MELITITGLAQLMITVYVLINFHGPLTSNKQLLSKKSTDLELKMF